MGITLVYMSPLPSLIHPGTSEGTRALAALGRFFSGSLSTCSYKDKLRSKELGKIWQVKAVSCSGPSFYRHQEGKMIYLT